MRRVFQAFGVYLFRCEECGHRFRASIQRFRYIFFAKCPSCHRMDLSRWSREYYSPTLITRIMLAMGAKPIRCEYCRNNFWSFRFVREKFSKEKRAARSQIVVPVDEDLTTEAGSQQQVAGAKR